MLQIVYLFLLSAIAVAPKVKYVVYSESSWTELVEVRVREGGLLTLASPTL
jgi:hypothetical protein